MRNPGRVSHRSLRNKSASQQAGTGAALPEKQSALPSSFYVVAILAFIITISFLLGFIFHDRAHAPGSTAQPNGTINLELKGRQFSVQVADTPELWVQGLSNRSALGQQG
jgi:hypothetical protein